MEHSDFLLEIGTEELPTKALVPLSESLARALGNRLSEARLTCGEIKHFASPRRLAVVVRDLALHQSEQSVERRGPAVKAAFDDSGGPSKAAAGFAKSCGVDVDQLERMHTDKGEWLVYRAVDPGKPARDVLPELVLDAISAIPIPKRMRWGAGDHIFVRPVHWLVALLGDSVVDLELFGIRSDRRTQGHRFHCDAPLQLRQATDYEHTMLHSGWVIADFATRRARIREQILEQAGELGGQVHLDEELLDEVTALSEWPVVVSGHFDERFLALPREVLIATLQDHQRYFPVSGTDGNLLPAFITVANIQSSQPEAVVHGNERVIRPRLSDALFFWEQDQLHTLQELCTQLPRVQFQKALGSLADKSTRIEALAQDLTTITKADSGQVNRAASLSKADLLTDMVGEFPQLQGTMGRHYAERSGEEKPIALALEEQYLPRFSGDRLPKSQLGVTLSIADRLDTLCGIFALGKKPTGEKDPYALRRAALSILRISIESELNLDLAPLVEHGFQLQPIPTPEDGKRDLLDFFTDRLKAYCLSQSTPVEHFNAVAAVQSTRPMDFRQRLDAVQHFLGLPQSRQLAKAHKRVRNILRRAGDAEVVDAVDEKVLNQEAGKTLYRCMLDVERRHAAALESGAYEQALILLAELGEPVDAFFDSVMVMDKDTKLRSNRLSLLRRLDSLCRSVADISCLPG